jgi:hypothetical protein
MNIEKANGGELILFDVFVDVIPNVEERSDGDLKILLWLE